MSAKPLREGTRKVAPQMRPRETAFCKCALRKKLGGGDLGMQSEGRSLKVLAKAPGAREGLRGRCAKASREKISSSQRAYITLRELQGGAPEDAPRRRSDKVSRVLGRRSAKVLCGGARSRTALREDAQVRHSKKML